MCTATPISRDARISFTAIRAACARLGTFHLEDCELYASCEPCPMCLAAAYWARVPRVVYAASQGDAARAGFADLVTALLDRQVSPTWSLAIALEHDRLALVPGRGLVRTSPDGHCAPEPLDVIFPVLHGPYGEDGTVQAELDQLGVAYTGCGAEAVAFASGTAATLSMAAPRSPKPSGRSAFHAASRSLTSRRALCGVVS